jgi:putative tryptophan/tyrosine transport system substrate-binding protein
MRRRDFVALLAGAATAWPLPLSAQKNEARRIAVLMGIAPTEQSQAYVAAFWRRLEEFGWTRDRNLRTDVRWWTREPEQNRTTVADLLTFSPDVILAFSNAALAIPSAPDLSPACPIPAAISRASPATTEQWAANGLRC